MDVINDVLDWSRIESDSIELKESNVAISDVANAAMRILSARAARGDLTMVAKIPENFPHLLADKRLIKQILINLLSNSVKFTKPGGTIIVGAHVTLDGSMAVWVNDTGIGMAQQDIAKAISAFGRLDDDFNRKSEGTGLGLSLVNSQISAHGGSLLVASAVGVGTTVTARFPPNRTVGYASVSEGQPALANSPVEKSKKP